MTFEELMAMIGKMEKGEEMIEAVTERLNKVNGEAKGQRLKRKEVEGKLEKFTSLTEKLEELGIDVDGDISEQLEDLGQSKTKSTKLEKEFLKLQKEFDTIKTEKQQLEIKGKKTKIKEALHKQFSENVYNSDVTLDYRIDKGDFYINDDGKVAFRNGDEEVTENIFDVYKLSHKDEIKVNHNGGPGGQPNSGSVARRI